MPRLSPLLPLVLLLGCAPKAPPPDPFAGWGGPPAVVVAPEEAAGDAAARAAEREAWLASPADWRAFDAERLEAEVLRRANRAREEAGVSALRYDPRLSAVARGHSVELSLAGVLSHTSPFNPAIALEDRVSLAGIPFRALAEDVASEPLVAVRFDSGREELYTWAEVAARGVDHWLASPPHREALLRKDLKVAGVGAAVATEADPPTVYLTLDLLR